MTKHYPFVLLLIAIFTSQLLSAQIFQKISTTNNLNPRNLADLNGTLFFSGFDFRGQELWKSDGTVGGTVFFKELAVGGAPGSDPRNYIRIGNELYFLAYWGDINAYPQISKTDGTVDGTVKLTNHHNPVFDDPQISFLTAVNNVLFYSAWGNEGKELFKITPGGPQMVKNIYQGTTLSPPPFPNSSYPENLTDVNGTLFFSANDGLNGVELWKSDGTDAGTILFYNINPTGNSDPSALANVNGTLFFSANNGINGVELWKSDGTEAGTVLVKDINPSGNSGIGSTVNVNGTAFFVATNGINGLELWKSDGTTNGTVMVRDINPAGNSYPANFLALNGILYFTADDGINGIELWRSDGSEAGTTMVRDINLAAGNSSPVRLTAIGNQIYFAANNGIIGVELWKSDGTYEGTVLVQDFNSGPGYSNVNNITQSGNLLYVVALDNTGFNQLYVTTIQVGSPLPVNLLAFSVQLQERDGVLNWKTSSEVNTSHFEIERSTNARNFIKVGSKDAKGNSSSFSNYSFKDPNITALGERVLYYRLKMLDQDGSFKYSAVMLMNISSKNQQLILYPNPAKDEITFMIGATRKEKVQLRIVDATGRVVKSMMKDLQSGSNSIAVSLRDVSAGTYMLIIEDSNGKGQHSFVKQ